jgi:hypothetical protein
LIDRTTAVLSALQLILLLLALGRVSMLSHVLSARGLDGRSHMATPEWPLNRRIIVAHDDCMQDILRF